MTAESEKTKRQTASTDRERIPEESVDALNNLLPRWRPKIWALWDWEGKQGANLGRRAESYAFRSPSGIAP